MAGKECMPMPKVRNVVANVDLGVVIDLKKLHKELLAAGHKDAKYDTSFAEIVSIYLPGTSVLGKIFATGKITCMGANSVDKARVATRKFARLVQTHGYPEARFQQFEIVNMLGNVQVKFKIHLTALMQELGKECRGYKETQSHILRYHMAEPKMVLNIFGNGKITFMGAKNDAHIMDAWTQLFPILEKFKK